MRPKAREMRRLLDQVAMDLGDGNTKVRLSDQREMFVAMVSEEPPAIRSRAVSIAVIAAVAAAAAVVSAVFFWPSNDRLLFWVGEERNAGTVGAWLASPDDGTTTVGFEQGSRVVLEKRATARVVAAAEDAVRIDLGQGALDADIVGNRKTRWTVDAGPFRVTVLGTRFTVRWNMETQVLDVRVRRGVVLVQGQGLSEHGMKVPSGNHLRAEGRTGFVSLNLVGSGHRGRYPQDPPARHRPAAPSGTGFRGPGHPPSEPPLQEGEGGRPLIGGELPGETGDHRPAASSEAPPPAHQTPSAEAAAPRDSSPAASPGDGVGTPAGPSLIFKRIEPLAEADAPASSPGDGPGKATPPEPQEGAADTGESPNRSWLSLYAREQFSRAVEEAEAIGIERLSRSLDGRDLWKLGDAARAAERIDIASTVLIAYRERFPGTRRARLASFLLGRIASDRSGGLRAAAGWFDTYLREDPEGPLAEEALGRLMTVYEKLGRRKEARSAARQYLRRYDEGTFDAVARSISETP